MSSRMRILLAKIQEVGARRKGNPQTLAVGVPVGVSASVQGLHFRASGPSVGLCRWFHLQRF